MIHLTETWKQTLDNRQVVGVVYIDFQKAFDTVSQTILRYKLEAIGITEDLLNWMISYLTNRNQFAIVDGCTSQRRNVCCGVPQGSCLGKDFSVSYYVNNLPDAVTEGELAIYADDTTLSVVGDNVEVVTDKLNKALASINLWCGNNKLGIHTGKSEAMILTHKPFCGRLKPVMLGNEVLDFVTETKCLEIIINNQLSWLSQIELICRSFGQKVNQLKRLKYLTKDTLQSIYFTSIIPTVTYCNLVWGTCSPTLLHEVEHIHARAAKIIYRLSDLSNQEAITIAGWQSINSMYKRKLLTFMYQVYKSELPDNIIRLFSSSNCCYDLLNSIKFEVPRFNLEVGRNSLRYRGALFWNSIPDNLKRAPSLNIFKKLLKKNRPLFDNINFNKMK